MKPLLVVGLHSYYSILSIPPPRVYKWVLIFVEAPLTAYLGRNPFWDVYVFRPKWKSPDFDRGGLGIGVVAAGSCAVCG